MIDEKKLIERFKHTPALRKIEHNLIQIVEEQPKVGEWIPVSERLPEIRKDCLVTVKYTGFMGMYGIWVKTGHLEVDETWLGDCIGGKVIAWQPLTEPYQNDEQEE